MRELRTLSKNLTLNYNRTVYQIHSPRPAYALRHAKVEVRERWDGGLTILYKGKPLTHSVYREPPRQAELFSSKQLNPELDARHRRQEETPSLRAAKGPSLAQIPDQRQAQSTLACRGDISTLQGGVTFLLCANMQIPSLDEDFDKLYYVTISAPDEFVVQKWADGL